VDDALHTVDHVLDDVFHWFGPGLIQVAQLSHFDLLGRGLFGHSFFRLYFTSIRGGWKCDCALFVVV
jgi:hypothetical protein